MTTQVDVAVIGAGTAGLSAVSEIRKVTQNFVMIQDGPLGTTCARVGCMPSKVLIQTANDFHRRHVFDALGIVGANQLSIDGSAVLRRVRKLRDRFVAGVVKGMEAYKDRMIHGRARFVESGVLDVDGRMIQCKAVVVATGSRTFVPPAWQTFGDHIITSDDVFEMERLPSRVVVVGLGVIGVELGQALARLGVDVVGVDQGAVVAGLSDPKVLEVVKQNLNSEFRIVLEQMAQIEREGDGVVVSAGSERFPADQVLVSIGRVPNLDGLGLENVGVSLDKRGQPTVDPTTMQVGDVPVFLAGDVNGRRPLLHEAADEGRIAGFNSVRPQPTCFRRRVRLGITFCDPNIVVVGQRFSDLDSDRLTVGEVSFETQGRSLVAAKNKGMARVYADCPTGRLLGAEMMVPEGEHLAHTMAWALQKEMTVFEALQMPYYHPVIEEGLRTAMRDLAQNVECLPKPLEMAMCESSAVASLM